MSIRTAVARLLIALALIVQIWAPVGSSVMMVAAATDPLAGMEVCQHDESGNALDPSGAGTASHALKHCDLCQLAAAGGWTPEAPAVVGRVEAPVARVATWVVRVETVVDARILARLRGRAPPSLA